MSSLVRNVGTIGGLTAVSRVFGFIRDMMLSRMFEERAVEEYTKGNIVGFLHLYPGEEAVGAGVINVTSTTPSLEDAYAAVVAAENDERTHV